MAKSAVIVANGKRAEARDTTPSFRQAHGVGKMSFSFQPATGKSSGGKSNANMSGTRGAMLSKIKMRPPPSGQKGTGHGAGHKPTSLTQFNKGLIVRGAKQLQG